MRCVTYASDAAGLKLKPPVDTVQGGYDMGTPADETGKDASSAHDNEAEGNALNSCTQHGMFLGKPSSKAAMLTTEAQTTPSQRRRMGPTMVFLIARC